MGSSIEVQYSKSKAWGYIFLVVTGFNNLVNIFFLGTISQHFKNTFAFLFSQLPLLPPSQGMNDSADFNRDRSEKSE